MGQTEPNVTGKKIEDVITIFDGTREVPASEYCPANKSADGMVFNKMNLRMPISGGKERIVNLVSGRIKEGISIHLGCVLTFQDVTHEYVVEKMKREFVSIAANMTSTPLTGMKWAVD